MEQNENGVTDSACSKSCTAKKSEVLNLAFFLLMDLRIGFDFEIQLLLDHYPTGFSLEIDSEVKIGFEEEVGSPFIVQLSKTRRCF